MIDIEEIIKRIGDADEVELMEFDFDECFKALREYQQLRAAAQLMVQSNYFKSAVISFERVLGDVSERITYEDT